MDGTNLTRLTNDIRFLDNHPSWSPDGTKIVFISNRDGGFDIYSMNVNGTNVTRLTFGFVDYDAAFQPLIIPEFGPYALFVAAASIIGTILMIPRLGLRN